MDSVPTLDAGAGRLTWFERTWQAFCRFVVRVFYRRFEVAGSENLPMGQGIILCANHVNALADAVVLQAATTKAIRPLARSGLFDSNLFWIPSVPSLFTGAVTPEWMSVVTGIHLSVVMNYWLKGRL
jgi:1-acyl-sn-glycerol-3-phosphate acyltransferase